MSETVEAIPRTGPRPDESRSLPEIGGIEITGVDLSDPLSQERKDWLMRVFRAHSVIVFRDQHLTKEQQYEFTLTFGEIEGAHVNRLIDPVKYTPVHTVSNIGPDGNPTAPKRERGNYYWHTDKSYHDVPSLLTMLHGIEIPSRGGETQFANTSMAYAALDDATKQRLSGLRAVHSWERSRIQSRSHLATEDQKRERPPVDHPIVRTHPDTGAKALYLGNHGSHVVGWQEDEGRALLRWLDAFATQAAYVYSHRWRPGDLVLWDNRCTLHRALPHEDMEKERRVLHRTVVKGMVPYLMHIVIPDDYQDAIERLACYSSLDGHDVTRYREPAASFEELVDRLRQADVIVAIRERVTFNRALIERLPNLKLIALVGRNATTIDYAACTEHGVMVSRGESNSPTSPAELTVALIVASRRNIVIEAERMRRGEWPYTLSHRLRGSTLGIFGLGNIGSLVAQAGAGMGMKVLVWGQANSAKRAAELGYGVADSKAALFEQSDVLSLHVRLRPDTTGIIGPEDLSLMKPTALIVNTSRAELIQPGALLGALRAGRPGYAAVDVYEQEPIMHGDQPFLSMPNVICTPHLGWAEWDNFELYYAEAFEQIAAFADGKALRLANPR